MSPEFDFATTASGMNLPYSTEAEQAVLASILIDPPCLNIVATEMEIDYFYLPQHKVIYRTLCSMIELSGKAIDFVSLLEQLKSDNTYDEAGWKSYLTQLVKMFVVPQNVMTYVGIVKERYYARSLLNAAGDIIKDVNENLVDADRLLENAEASIYRIRQGRETSGLTHVKSIIEDETFDRLNKLNNPETRDDFIGIPTGISALDKITTGLNKSDLIILGARPGMGKTSLALNIARNVAVQSKKTVCFFSLEMTRDQLAQRLLSNEASIQSTKLRTGELEGEEWVRLAQAGKMLSEAELYFDETPGITVQQMKAKLRRMKKVDLVVIDYLGLISPSSNRKSDNRVQQVQEITGALKAMAKELKVPVLCCAQLSRGTEQKGKSHKPALSDLRESGSIEQDADQVLFIYRETYYDNEKGDEEQKGNSNESEIIIAKNRHGSVDTVKLYWDGQFTRFASQEFNR